MYAFNKSYIHKVLRNKDMNINDVISLTGYKESQIYKLFSTGLINSEVELAVFKDVCNKLGVSPLYWKVVDK